jgi:putative oxidoreductase
VRHARRVAAAELAAVVLRLFTAFVLVYGTQDNIFSHARMLEFRDFLQQNRFPYPLASAYLSAYAQFTTGILLGLGLFTRAAGLVMVVNFVVALVMVHRGLPFSANIAPLAMLINALFFAIAGAPVFSLDGRRATAQTETINNRGISHTRTPGTP